MKQGFLMSLIFTLALLYSLSSSTPEVWGIAELADLREYRANPCPATFNKATFTETTANYPVSGRCFDGRILWQYSGAGAYQAGQQFGTAKESFNFFGPDYGKGPLRGQMRLTMGDCYSDPWIDDGICNPNKLQISWEGPGSADVLRTLLSGGAAPQTVTPPFSASILRNNYRAQIQAYRAQRQADLEALAAKRKQEQLAALTARPPKGAGRLFDLMYRPQILSPAESGRFVIGNPIMLMVKPPEKGVLGTTLRVVYQFCNWNQSRNACDWVSAGQEPNVSTMDAQAGSHQLQRVSRRGRWRINIVNLADGVDSPWRNFSVISVAQPIGPTGPTKGPVFGR